MKRYSIHVMFALLLLIMSAIGGRYIPSAFADNNGYTTAIADLERDETFKPSAYPDNSEDIKIQLIQIAESEDKKLFVYTYQPCQRTTYLVATELNMSLSESVDGTKLYPLELLNVSGTLCKYRVTGVTVSDAKARYYNISSIYREWIKGVDPEPDNDNTTNAVAYSVGKIFKVETVDGQPSYSEKTIDVIEIIDPFVGYIQYYDGLQWDFIFNYTHYTDVHYIAFDTDLKIDTLEEADISYYTQSYSWRSVGNEWTYGEKSERQYLPLTGEMTGGNEGDGFLGLKYTWKRIQRSVDFKKSVELSPEAENAVDKTKWVLVFLETSYTQSHIETFGGMEVRRSGTRVSEVTILRLQFVTGGRRYNLGAVSNSVTEGDKPSGSEKPLNWLDRLCKWLEQQTGIPAWIWKIIICVLPFVILLPILSVFFPIVGVVLLNICKSILRLLFLPFKGIAALVRKIKDKKDGSA